MKKLLKNRRGTTLVEVLVCAALLSLFAASLAMLINPFSKMFLQIQSLTRAQLIAGTMLDDLRGEVLNAQGYIRVCDFGNVFATSGDPLEGTGIEFKNRNGYIQLIDAGGSPATQLRKRDGTILETVPAVSHDRLIMRYFLAETADAGGPDVSPAIPYYYQDGSQYTARELTKVYDDKFYMGNDIRLTFALNPDAEGRVYSLKATVYVGVELSEPYSQSMILDLVNGPELARVSGAKIK